MALCVKTSLMPPVTTTCYSHLKPSVGTNSDLLCGSKHEGFALEYCLHLLFTRFDVCSFLCGSAAVNKHFIHKDVNINGYVQYNCQRQMCKNVQQWEVRIILRTVHLA